MKNEIDLRREIDNVMSKAIKAAEPWAVIIRKIRDFERPTFLISERGIEKIDDGLSKEDKDTIEVCNTRMETIYSDAGKIVQQMISRSLGVPKDMLVGELLQCQVQPVRIERT